MNTEAQLIQQLEATAAEKDFSGVISITEHGNTIFEQAYGYANRSDRIKNLVNTRFGIASGTKGFTALAINCAELIFMWDLSVGSEWGKISPSVPPVPLW